MSCCAQNQHVTTGCENLNVVYHAYSHVLSVDVSSSAGVAVDENRMRPVTCPSTSLSHRLLRRSQIEQARTLPPLHATGDELQQMIVRLALRGNLDVIRLPRVKTPTQAPQANDAGCGAHWGSLCHSSDPPTAVASPSKVRDVHEMRGLGVDRCRHELQVQTLRSTSHDDLTLAQFEADSCGALAPKRAHDGIKAARKIVDRHGKKHRRRG